MFSNERSEPSLVSSFLPSKRAMVRGFVAFLCLWFVFQVIAGLLTIGIAVLIWG